MDIDQFDYPLRKELIAQEPLRVRSNSRLLVDLGEETKHLKISDLPDFLTPGDLLVLNNTRVLPARLKTFKSTGGEVEVLLLEQTDNSSEWKALVRPSRRIKEGSVFNFGDDFRIVVNQDLGEGIRNVHLDADPDLVGVLEKYGEMPLPPYIENRIENQERYQTVYSQRPASVAAPTAGLHLTNELLEKCLQKGIKIEFLELVVGLDTFRPVKVQNIEKHKMHSESFHVPDKTIAACRDAKRVIAVGTTTVRALETSALQGSTGRSQLFIREPFEFKVVDLLLTNFHLPRSTLLVMIDAFIGSRWRYLYELALAENYRFLSFGDAMLIENKKRLIGES